MPYYIELLVPPDFWFAIRNLDFDRENRRAISEKRRNLLLSVQLSEMSLNLNRLYSSRHQRALLYAIKFTREEKLKWNTSNILIKYQSSAIVLCHTYFTSLIFFKCVDCEKVWRKLCNFHRENFTAACQHFVHLFQSYGRLHGFLKNETVLVKEHEN